MTTKKLFHDLRPGDLIPISKELGFTFVISCKARGNMVDFVLLNTELGIIKVSQFADEKMSVKTINSL